MSANASLAFNGLGAHWNCPTCQRLRAGVACCNWRVRTTSGERRLFLLGGGGFRVRGAEGGLILCATAEEAISVSKLIRTEMDQKLLDREQSKVLASRPM